MTDVGVKELAANCKHMASLDIMWCKKVTDAGTKELAANCKLLSSLNLEGCEVTDAGIKELARGCTLLSYLNLAGCEDVTEACITQMSEIMEIRATCLDCPTVPMWQDVYTRCLNISQ